MVNDARSQMGRLLQGPQAAPAQAARAQRCPRRDPWTRVGAALRRGARRGPPPGLRAPLQQVPAPGGVRDLQGRGAHLSRARALPACQQARRPRPGRRRGDALARALRLRGLRPGGGLLPGSQLPCRGVPHVRAPGARLPPARGAPGALWLARALPARPARGGGGLRGLRRPPGQVPPAAQGPPRRRGDSAVHVRHALVHDPLRRLPPVRGVRARDGCGPARP
mmetsp:Transcript_26470/g.88698  ORF Transcript_26470/g.88698 Transcript_26470/m.88698 type:complete len:223 (+) Transcript_26470:321-989(+)